MIETIMQYKIYITIGVLIIPSFLCILYITKRIIKNKRERNTTNWWNTKKTDPSIRYTTRDDNKYILTMIENLRKDLYTWKSEIYTKNDIEYDIDNFYKQTWSQQNIRLHPQRYQEKSNQEEEILHKEQVRIMNQNISKFLIIYREKDKIIEGKDKHIQTLQQRLNEIEREIENIYTHKKKTEYMFDQRLYEVTKKIQEEEKRTIILIVLFILVVLANIWGCIYMSI